MLLTEHSRYVMLTSDGVVINTINIKREDISEFEPTCSLFLLEIRSWAYFIVYKSLWIS